MIPAAIPLAVVLAAALLLRQLDRRREGEGLPSAALVWVSLLPLALVIAAPLAAGPVRGALVAALAVALLARNREDLAQSECALKLTWVFGAAFALSWAGDSLLALAAGTAVRAEQWNVLSLRLDPYGLWTGALALALLAGAVLLGGAPFHFWLADVFHGARPHLAPLVVAAPQAVGAAWLAGRLAGIEDFPGGAAFASGLLSLAAALALVGGAATLATQRRPERRVGTLASLQGALVLAAFAADPGLAPFAEVPGALAAWSTHLALALTGAGALARFLAVDSDAADGPVVLFRRHPWSGVLGALALLSLAGAPFTPGMFLWLAVARRLAATNHPGLLLALAAAWLVAFAVTAGEVRRAFGAPDGRPAPGRGVPWPAHAAFALCAACLMALEWGWWRR
jgi:NADH:ubiquinone oxidoreductase subunit 2 (subunit N)